MFCFGGVGCSVLRPAQGALTPPLGTKHPHLLCGINFQELKTEKIATGLFSLLLLGCYGCSTLRRTAGSNKFCSIEEKFTLLFAYVIRYYRRSNKMSYEYEIICQETDEKGQVKNLNVIMQLLLQQYHDFVDRKERLENKALGHLTPLSILMAATVAILIMLAQADDKGLSFIVFLFSFWAQVYFSIFTFFMR